MAEIVGLGVVGAGAIAQRGILPHLSLEDVQDRVQLVAICDPAPGRAEAAAAHYNLPHAFTDYASLLAHGKIDAVTIASPIGLHYTQGRMALEAGKHVHFNKTMTTTAAEATELIDLAQRKNLRIVASPGEVLRPQVQAVKQLIASGAIGTLCWAICGASLGSYHEDEEFRQGADPLTNIDPSWYFRTPGGGPLYDMTVYALHSLTSVLGPARAVTAMSGTRIPEREFRGRSVPVDAHDSTLIAIDFGGNLFAMAYGMSAGSVNTGFAARYFGTSGEINGYALNNTPIDYPGKQLVDQGSGAGAAALALPHVVGAHRTIEEHHVFEDIMQLVDWVRDGTPSPVTAEHARHVVEIIEAAYRAAETGQAQVLTTTF